MLHVDNLQFGYGSTLVLNSVSFSLSGGQTAALVGDNGAGKTTLLRCLAGLERPLAGSIRLDGISMQDNPIKARQRLGYVRDLFGLYDEMTGREFLRYIAATRKVSAKEYSAQEAWLADGLDLTPILDKDIRAMTRGMRQKIALAQAFVHNPSVLLLDEPASGLDPDARQLLSQFMNAARAQGKTILVSSHILGELQHYSSAMLVLKGGVLTHVADTTSTSDAKAATDDIRVYTLTLRALPGKDAALKAHLQAAHGLTAADATGGALVYQLRSDEASIAALLTELTGLKQGLVSFEARLPSLTDMYNAANKTAAATDTLPLLRLATESRVTL